MTQTTREELAGEVDQARWDWLKPHYGRGVLFLVDELLDLPEVGARIAADDSAAVQAWLASKLLAKPTAEQVDCWDRQPDRRFSMLVVRPFVLIQG